VVGIGGGGPLPRFCDAITHPVEIDGQETPVLDDEARVDHDAGDGGAVLRRRRRRFACRQPARAAVFRLPILATHWREIECTCRLAMFLNPQVHV
jgi:hypothetical protein